MNRKLAFDNRLCYERDVSRQHARLHHKLTTILPTARSPSRVFLDSNAPAQHPHLASNAKRLQVEREKQLLIYQQNQRLANRMDHIMRRHENATLAASAVSHERRTQGRTLDPTKSIRKDSELELVSAPTTSPRPAPSRSPRKTPTPLTPAHVHIPGVRLDANQSPLIDCHLSPEFSTGRGNACAKQTLVNKFVQRRQQAQIVDENRRLQQRLAKLKPYYNTKKWDGEWQQHSKKFNHLRQDGTVGYLLPPPKTATAADSRPTTKAGRQREDWNDGSALPSIHTSRDGRSHRNRGRKQHQERQPTAELQDDEEEMQLVELPPCVLLEATTRKGVEITVSELPIELVQLGDLAANARPDFGDRGLIISGCWFDDDNAYEGQFLVDLRLLAQVAQELDDLETMIKLETVSEVPDVGNFPRLSSLLTEEELQQLLVGVIQHLRFQVAGKQLRITSRLPSSAAAASPRPPNGSSEGSPHRARPRTCPSTISSDAHLVVTATDDALESMNLDETSLQSSMIKREFAAALNPSGRARRLGVRIGNQFALVSARFDQEYSTQSTTVLHIGPDDIRMEETRTQLNTSQLEVFMHQLDTDKTPHDLIIQQLQEAT